MKPRGGRTFQKTWRSDGCGACSSSVDLQGCGALSCAVMSKVLVAVIRTSSEKLVILVGAKSVTNADKTQTLSFDTVHHNNMKDYGCCQLGRHDIQCTAVEHVGTKSAPQVWWQGVIHSTLSRISPQLADKPAVGVCSGSSSLDTRPRVCQAAAVHTDEVGHGKRNRAALTRVTVHEHTAAVVDCLRDCI